MKKLLLAISILALGLIYQSPTFFDVAYAETAITTKTALPKLSSEHEDCSTFDKYIAIEQLYSRKVNGEYDNTQRVQAGAQYKSFTRQEQYDVIACSLKSGRFHLFMVPYMIRYFVELIIQLSGLVCVLYIVVGAYQYIIGSVSENKQQGKDTITNALIGLVITLMAWIIVNVVQVALTTF